MRDYPTPNYIGCFWVGLQGLGELPDPNPGHRLRHPVYAAALHDVVIHERVFPVEPCLGPWFVACF